MSLHDELERIAERAPVADVPSDTWARARRAGRRDRALAAATTIAVVALLAAAVSWLPSRLEAPVADGGRLGVPDHLYAVPERMSARNNDGSWMRDQVTDDPTIVGVGAAAWLTEGGLPVVVSASDGRYHLLDLPDFGGNNDLVARGMAPPTVTLSPDGTRLAYSYAIFGKDAATAPIPSGIRVLDLTTGTVRSIPVPGDEGTAVATIVWSSDGRWLGFSGLRLHSWTTWSMGGGDPVVGRVAPGTATADQHRVPDAEAMAISVDDNGLVRVLGNGQRVRWDSATWNRSELRDGNVRSGRAVVVGHGAAAGSFDGLTVRVVPDVGGQTMLRAAGDLPPRGGGDVDVLGQVGSDLVVRTRSLDSADGQLLLVGPGGTNRPVGVVEAGVGADLSVATDLMSANLPTVSRPEPDWPLSDERRAVIIGLAALAALAAAVAIGRRYRVAR